MNPQSIGLSLLLMLCLSFSVFAQETNCNNGIDDDGDGLVDCFDNDCIGIGTCLNVESNCTDGLDNDGDGLPDCLDSDCKGTSFCPVETNCNNGIDDDGDGFFDYYDGDCLADPDNPNDFIIDIASCEVRPNGNSFDLQVEWESEDQVLSTINGPLVADLDQDGISEVIAYQTKIIPGRTYNELNILSGRYEGGGKNPTQRSVEISRNQGWVAAIADIDKDGFGEIIILDRSEYLRCFEHDLTLKWGSNKDTNDNSYRIASNDPTIGIADFNQDGNAEIYAGNEIRDANTGNLIIPGSHGTTMYPTGNHIQNELSKQAVAVDILPGYPGLELVLGHVIYAVDIAGGTLTEVRVMDNAATKPADYATKFYPDASGFSNATTTVVDYDQDGYLDVLLPGSTGHPTNGPTTVYYWNVQQDFVRSYQVVDPQGRTTGKYDNNSTWKPGTGSLNVADINGDGRLECTFASGQNLYAMNNDWTGTLWVNSTTFQEGSSGITGTTVFDFDGDGTAEILYRDEIGLYVVDGLTGQPLGSFTNICSSNTGIEYPIVADVDGDGETEIVVGCSSRINVKGQGNATTADNKTRGTVKVFGAVDGTFWVPSRSVWNQHSYFNVNINDDLTVPRYQQPHHLRYAQECNLLPTSSSTFSLNKFLNQSPKINYCGELQFPSPRLDFTTPPQVFPPTCPNNRFQVRLQFTNSGDDIVGRPIPIAFYQNDPQVAYANTDPNPHLETIYLDIPSGLAPGESLDTLIWVNGIPGPFTLYTSLNDIGPFDQTTGSSLSNSAFYPLDELNGTIRECDNNPDVAATPVNPFPFQVTAAVAQDNSKCAGAFDSDGIVTANVGGDTLNFVFRWYEGNVVKPTPDYLGATQTGLTGGTYLVVAESPGANCSSASQTVVVEDLATPPVVVTSVTNDQVSCDPANPTGALSAYVDEGGSPVTTGYDFFWYRGLNNVIPARNGYTGGPTVDQLPSGNYRLVVSDAATGCITVQDIFLPENQVTPPIRLDNQVDVTVCDPAFADGEAEVSVNGNTTDYDFYWYQGSVSSPDTTSANVIFQGNYLQNVMDGTYTVFAADQTTRCLSDPLVITIDDNSVNPLVNTTVLAPQSACDPTLYNGSLQATVDETASGGSATETTGYTFDWYQGNITLTTLPATPYASGSTMTGAPDGNYSVVVTRTATGCQSIVYRALPRQIIRPVIDLNATLVHADNCTDPWGSSITVSADGGQTSADSYTFEWRDAGGTVIAGETTETLSNIPPGVYTVLVTSPLGCTAQNTAQYEILDQAPKPVVTLQRFNNSSCDPGQPNGVVAATGFTKPVDAYIWEWFETSPSGAPVAAANYSANGDTIFNLSANTYALQITDTLTRCSSVRFINLSDNPATPPALDTLSVTATTDCRAISADGEVIFEVVGGAQPLPYNASTNRTYTFRLYTGTAATGAPLATNATGVFSGLNFNDYTATVEDDFTRCVSPPMTISIEQDPDITITRDHQVSPISCAVADGEIGVEVTSPSNTAPSGAGYSFTWYSLGNSKNGPATINPGADLPTLDNFSSRRQGLTTGYYVVEVSDNFTSCTVYDTLFLPQANPPIINASTTPSDQCSPGTGDIDLTLDPNGFSLDRYHVYLYIGNSLDLGNEIDTLNPSGMAIVSLSFPDYAPQQYTIGIIDTISGCPINSETVRIDLNNPDPSISFTAAADYTCNADGTGLLDAYVEGGGDNDNVQGNFTFEWFSGTNTSTPLNVATQVDPSDPSIAINLLEGFYTVRVTDNDGPGNGCSYTQTYFLPKQYRTIAISSTNALPDSVCGPTPTGTIWIETVTEDGAAVSLADYTFELLNDSFTLQANAGSGTASDPFVALPEGSYYVRATNQLTDCETVSNLIPIDNTAESPAITIIEEAPDFSCAMGSSTDGTGELNATALGTFDNDTNQDHFTYTWFAGSDTLSANQLLPANIDSSDPSRTIGLTAGLYTVLVQDTSGHSNQCIFFSTHEVTSVEREVILTLDSDPQQLCSPADGTAFVTDTREEYFFNGIQVIDTDPIDYTYVLYDDDLTAPPSVIGTGLNTPTDKFQELAEGTYFITTDSTDNCYSAPTPVAVDNISEDPLVSIALLAAQYSQNPDPTSWTGALQAQVQVHPDQPLDSINDAFTYQYRWYDAANYTLGNELGTNDAIAQLDSGEYLLEVTNLVTNCVNTATFYLPFVEVEPQLLMQANPQTVCFANGSLTLDSITFLGQADPTEDYLIRLYANVYDTTQAATDSVMNFSGTTPFDSLLAGTYYLQAFHQTLYLSSNVLQLDITDESTPPLIEILDLQLQVSCDTARLATGAIAIQAIEADGTYDPYTYRWFRGQTTNPINELVLETTPEIDSLPSGFYTVLVENQRTRCSTLEPIFVPEDITLPDITASTTPASVCDPALANGAVRAEPLSVGNYRYDWYRGDTIRLAPDFTGQVWAGVMPGNYTVTATDIATNTCVSPPITVTVADESTLPIVTVEMENPYTTCDPLRPNGTLYAVSDGPPANFTYLWYDTLNQIVGDLPRAFNLTPQTYRVAVTDITTGCTTEAVGTIVRDEQIVIPPTVDIQSHMTNCAQPDGAATAAVNGDIDGYAFLFYDADGNPLPDSLIQVNESDLQVSVSQLAAGTYQVTATDLATDCVSEITFFDILDEGYTPPFRAETTPASCGDSNGSATIIPSDNLRLLSTVWTTPEANVVVSEGNVTKNLPAGTLAVEMRWENGCSYFGTIEIGTDICVYNTVTPNGDGDHDFLEIGAIEQFPDNSVKIFNRAGALVYESERYNNQNTRFEGTGNRGLYLGGQQLPDGTYFFVIDKKNGSQPKTGYLELIR